MWSRKEYGLKKRELWYRENLAAITLNNVTLDACCSETALSIRWITKSALLTSLKPVLTNFHAHHINENHL